MLTFDFLFKIEVFMREKENQAVHLHLQPEYASFMKLHLPLHLLHIALHELVQR